jgi:acetylornithine deacetylase/succinyl-diaminopimelate desuccinylase-like protein
MSPDDPVRILQDLIRFRTVNPPGDEAACIRWIHDLLQEAGIESRMLGPSPERQNLVARLPGRGTKPPFLMYGHVDVVPADGQSWTHPPFEGVIADGCVWGRGAVDMKGAIAMMLAALVRLKRGGEVPEGDIIFAAVADEERFGTHGARWLVQHHPDLFAGVRHAIGEFGGISMPTGGVRLYPVAVAEKQACPLEVVFRGPGGHGSMPLRGSATAKLGEALRRIDRRRLPVRITPPVRASLVAMARALPFPLSAALRLLAVPSLTDAVLGAIGHKGRFLDPLLHDTVSATVVHGGEALNVIPAEVKLALDGRLVPGGKPDELLAEVRALLGPDAEVRVVEYEPGPAEADLSLIDTLAGVLREGDPEGVPVPFVLAGVTDARIFSTLGIQTYGFTPLKLPPDLVFAQLLHAADERVPVEALAFGTEAIHRLLRRS